MGFWINTNRRPPPAQLALTWLSAGRSLTVILQTPDGKTYLINPQNQEDFDTSQRVIMPYLTQQGVRALDAVVVTRLQPITTQSLSSLGKSISIRTVLDLSQSTTTVSLAALRLERLPESQRFPSEPPLLITYREHYILLAGSLSLDAQEGLVQRAFKNLDLLQARFSKNLRWKKEFLEKFHPEVLVETGPDSTFRPSCVPWDGKTAVVPKKRGWYRWTAD
jgi:hypothetical protein